MISSVIVNVTGKAEQDNPEAPVQFWEGTYQEYKDPQAPTGRGFAAYYIYEPELGRIMVFNQETKDFVTACLMDDKEVQEFEKTRNFGGGSGWFTGKPKNIPPSEELYEKIKLASPIDMKAIRAQLNIQIGKILKTFSLSNKPLVIKD